MFRTALHRPLVVGTLTGPQPLPASLSRARSAGVDIVEVRLDTFSAALVRKAPAFLKSLRAKIKKPLLITFRSSREGGQGRWSASEREQVLESGLPYATFVDVEILEAALARRLTRAARRKKVRVIHSIHHFSPGLRWRDLERASRASLHMGDAIFKAAVMPRDNDELEAFLHKGKELPNPQKILIGMGNAGLPSRVVGFSFGSMMTFGHLGRSAAPGQMPAAELSRIIRDVYGQR